MASAGSSPRLHTLDSHDAGDMIVQPLEQEKQAPLFLRLDARDLVRSQFVQNFVGNMHKGQIKSLRPTAVRKDMRVQWGTG